MNVSTLQRRNIMVAPAPMWTIDPDHSTISFSVKYMMITTVHGRFDSFRGRIKLDLDRPDNAAVEVEIDADSINTGIGARDTHLRSADFFDVERYPKATFRSTSIESNGGRFVIAGELTIRGITRSLSLRAKYLGSGINPSGVEVAGFEATGKLNRKDFGLNWNQALESGGVLVSDEVKLTTTIEAARIAL